MFKKVLFILIFVAISAALLCVLLFLNQVNLTVSSDDSETLFEIHAGEGVKEIAANLVSQNLVRSQFWFESYVYIDRSESEFVAGNYLLRPNMNIREVVRALTVGQTVAERWIKVEEGWTARKIASYLQNEGVMEANDFLQAAASTDSRVLIPEKQFSVLQDKPADQGLEGYLFPDSYRIYEDSNAADIIERMLDNFDDKFTDSMYEAARNGNMSIYEIITLASIIEKEVAIELDDDGVPANNDHYIVAGIFYDRMNTGVALQSDATVNYVTNKVESQPSLDDLEVDNPYNTYKYRGLPPGPICNPSLEAIKAVLYPEKTDYFYFLHRVNDDGSIVFSKTYDEHLENKAKYLQ